MEQIQYELTLWFELIWSDATMDEMRAVFGLLFSSEILTVSIIFLCHAQSDLTDMMDLFPT